MLLSLQESLFLDYFLSILQISTQFSLLLQHLARCHCRSDHSFSTSWYFTNTLLWNYEKYTIILFKPLQVGVYLLQQFGPYLDAIDLKVWGSSHWDFETNIPLATKFSFTNLSILLTDFHYIITLNNTELLLFSFPDYKCGLVSSYFPPMLPHPYKWFCLLNSIV